MYIDLKTPRARRVDERTVPAGDTPLTNARAVSSHLAGALKKATRPHPLPAAGRIVEFAGRIVSADVAGRAAPDNLGGRAGEGAGVGAPDEGNFGRSIDSQRAAPHGEAAST